jgi:His-Xaa-Ser system protein HxsD
MDAPPLDNLRPSDGISVHEFRVSSEAFSWASIKKASYSLSGRCSFDFQSEGKEIVCRLLFPVPQSQKVIAAIELAFRNELLDQDLRALIAEETAPFRNAILAFAFSKTGVQDSDGI